jgi:hypothetical protein
MGTMFHNVNINAGWTNTAQGWVQQVTTNGAVPGSYTIQLAPSPPPPAPVLLPMGALSEPEPEPEPCEVERTIDLLLALRRKFHA